MGLFSSIGGVLGTLAGVALAPATGGASLAIPLAGGALGGAAGAAIDGNQANKKAEGYYNQQMAFAQQQAQFQQDYVKKAMQWRVEDAKQAGVHPMAALGFQSPSYSPISAPSAPTYMDSSNFDTGSTFGQTMNNAIFAGKTQQQQLQAGNLSNRNLELQNQHMELTNLQLASEIQRASMTTKAKPDVNGQGALGVIGGQQDSLPSAPEKAGYIGEPEIQFNPTASDPNVFVMNAGNDVTGLWEDKDIAGVIPLDLWPLIKANAIDYGSRLRGKIVNGMVYSNARNGWVSVNGPYGKEALADRLGLNTIVKPLRKALNPRGKKTFDPAEYARGFYTY